MATLKECQNELNSIIRELEDIEAGIRRSFQGIGEKKCADKVGKIVDKYKYVKRQLDNVDENVVAEIVNGD